mgnify:CR=1 FL=1
MRRTFTVVVALLWLTGFLALDEGHAGDGIKEDAEMRWYVYRDADSSLNHGEWTNWMPGNAGKMVQLDLTDKTEPASGSTAVRVVVKLEDPNWCGIAVASFPDGWGLKPQPAYEELKNAKKLVFFARGHKGEGETIKVKVAIAGDKPHGDSAKIPAETEWITLGKSWKKYELSLKGYDLTRVITPFAFVTDKAHNSGGALTFYLDDIYFVLEEGK